MDLDLAGAGLVTSLAQQFLGAQDIAFHYITLKIFIVA